MTQFYPSTYFIEMHRPLNQVTIVALLGIANKQTNKNPH